MRLCGHVHVLFSSQADRIHGGFLHGGYLWVDRVIQSRTTVFSRGYWLACATFQRSRKAHALLVVHTSTACLHDRHEHL